MAYTATNGVVTTVDCHKQVRSWRLLRSLMELLIPTCNNCTFFEEQERQETATKSQICHQISQKTTITGTIFGHRKGKVSFCIQTDTKSANPVLLLELAVPTSILAKEMRGGTLRIVLESSSGIPANNNNSSSGYFSNNNNLFSTPLWTMYCNGRKVGYAVKRRASDSDIEALRLMSSVSVGTGVINTGNNTNDNDNDKDDELMYLRANFERVRGSSMTNSESFHLIDPEGTSIGQELSIFFCRSRS